jgi:hypothetical protein
MGQMRRCSPHLQIDLFQGILINQEGWQTIPSLNSFSRISNPKPSQDSRVWVWASVSLPLHLEHYAVFLRGQLPLFLLSFLQDVFSALYQQNYRVPQRSVLNVILFAIVINGMVSTVAPLISTYLYVGDIAVCYSSWSMVIIILWHDAWMLKVCSQRSTTETTTAIQLFGKHISEVTLSTMEEQPLLGSKSLGTFPWQWIGMQWMGLDTKSCWLTDRQSQCDLDFDLISEWVQS